MTYRPIAVVIALVAMLSAAFGQAAAPQASPEQSALNALTQQYQLARREYLAPDPDRQGPPDPTKNPAIQFRPRALELAQRHRNTSVGLQAHVIARQMAIDMQDIKTADQDLEAILRAYANQPYFAPHVLRLAPPGTPARNMQEMTAASDVLLRQIEAASTNAEVLANAMLRRANMVQGDAALEQHKALLARFPNSEAAKTSQRAVFEAENLVEGKRAPDFEATDIDGKTFKLSDYRGKVVVLEFWGFW
jgi:hypothetical protein